MSTSHPVLDPPRSRPPRRRRPAGPRLAAGGLLLAVLACGPGDAAAGDGAGGGPAEPGGARPSADGASSPDAAVGDLPGSFAEARDAAFALVGRAPDAEAREALLVAHRLDPEAYGVNVTLGQVCERLGLAGEAADAYGRAHAAKPDVDATHLAWVGQLVEAGRAAEARAELAGLAAREGLAGDALLLEVRLLGREPAGDASSGGAPEGGSHGGARDGVEASGSSGGATVPGARELALADRARALDGPAAAEALAVLGRRLHVLGLHADARDVLLDAVARAPDDTGAIKNLSAACWRLGLEDEGARWQEVVELMLGLDDNVFTREQDNAASAASQAEALERSDWIRAEYEKHRQRLERLVVIHPGWGEAFLRLAERQAEDGDDAAACATIRAWAERHGAEAGDDEVRGLVARYCR